MIILLVRRHQHILVTIRGKLFQLFLVAVNHIVDFLGITARDSSRYIVVTQEIADLLVLVGNLVLSLLYLLTQLLILTDSVCDTKRKTAYDKTRKSTDCRPNSSTECFYSRTYNTERSHKGSRESRPYVLQGREHG